MRENDVREKPMEGRGSRSPQSDEGDDGDDSDNPIGRDALGFQFGVFETR
ncbi:hypothetical protein Hanom_Chr12g01100291 [Helianthus anomalus]